MVKRIVLGVFALWTAGVLASPLDAQLEKDKIKALRNGPHGASLLHAIRACAKMNGGMEWVPGDMPDMDYKVKCWDATWLFDGEYSGVMPKGTVLRSDQMGNYMAGYAAGYSDSPRMLYLGVRIGGIRSAIIADNERWLDQESVPDIWNGFLDGFNDFAKDHPARHQLRGPANWGESLLQAVCWIGLVAGGVVSAFLFILGTWGLAFNIRWILRRLMRKKEDSSPAYVATLLFFYLAFTIISACFPKAALLGRVIMGLMALDFLLELAIFTLSRISPEPPTKETPTK